MVDRAKATLIIATIADGKSLRRAGAEHGIAPSTFLGWVAVDKDLAERYARAREVMIDQMAEETLDIADDGSNDWMEKNDPNNPGYAFNGEAAARSRLRVDTRKWYASKLAPKRYGEKLAVTGGDENDNPLKIEHTVGGEAGALVAEILKGITNGE